MRTCFTCCVNVITKKLNQHYKLNHRLERDCGLTIYATSKTPLGLHIHSFTLLKCTLHMTSQKNYKENNSLFFFSFQPLEDSSSRVVYQVPTSTVSQQTFAICALETTQGRTSVRGERTSTTVTAVPSGNLIPDVTPCNAIFVSLPFRETGCVLLCSAGILAFSGRILLLLHWFIITSFLKCIISWWKSAPDET